MANADLGPGGRRVPLGILRLRQRPLLATVLERIAIPLTAGLSITVSARYCNVFRRTECSTLSTTH
jgi:hypothetical protein